MRVVPTVEADLECRIKSWANAATQGKIEERRGVEIEPARIRP
jgi:hypothetical protein